MPKTCETSTPKNLWSEYIDHRIISSLLLKTEARDNGKGPPKPMRRHTPEME